MTYKYKVKSTLPETPRKHPVTAKSTVVLRLLSEVKKRKTIIGDG
jgi:hypothetical protein